MKNVKVLKFISLSGVFREEVIFGCGMENVWLFFLLFVFLGEVGDVEFLVLRVVDFLFFFY